MTEGKVVDFPKISEVDKQFIELERQQQIIRQQAIEILKKLAKPKEKYPKRFSKISKAQRFRGIL